MKLIKLTIFSLIVLSFASCVKAKNDFAGLREDEGNIVTAITEAQYLVSDAHNLQFGYGIYTSFDFAAPATESVKFFTIHVSQPRSKKISGNMTVKLTVSAPDPSTGNTLPPAGAISWPSEITIPASEANYFDVPVKINVNKATLDPNGAYGAKFTLSSVSQGVTSALENSVEVSFINSKVIGRYNVTTTVKDSANQYGITNNTKPVLLLSNGTYSYLEAQDIYSGSFGLQVVLQTTGATASLITPRYTIDANGKVTAVLSRTTLANYGATIDPVSQFVYTANDNRSFTLHYTVRLATTINGVTVTRPFEVTEKYVYAPIQAF
jgi:hypothetical protein